jgi:hypothetical protein
MAADTTMKPCPTISGLDDFLRYPRQFEAHDGSVFHFQDNFLKHFKTGYKRVPILKDTLGKEIDHYVLCKLNLTGSDAHLGYSRSSAPDTKQQFIVRFDTATQKLSCSYQEYFKKDEDTMDSKIWVYKLGDGLEDIVVGELQQFLDFKCTHLFHKKEINFNAVFATMSSLTKYHILTHPDKGGFIRCAHLIHEDDQPLKNNISPEEEEWSRNRFVYPLTSLMLDCHMFSSLYLLLWHGFIKDNISRLLYQERIETAYLRFASMIGTGQIKGGLPRGEFIISNADDPINGEPTRYTDENELIKSDEHMILFANQFEFNTDRECHDNFMSKQWPRQEALLQSLKWMRQNPARDELMFIRIQGGGYDNIRHQSTKQTKNTTNSKDPLVITVMYVKLTLYRYHLHLFLMEFLTTGHFNPNKYDIFNYHAHVDLVSHKGNQFECFMMQSKAEE